MKLTVVTECGSVRVTRTIEVDAAVLTPQQARDWFQLLGDPYRSDDTVPMPTVQPGALQS